MAVTGILLLSGSHARAHAAFTFAAGAAALGRPVVLFATNEGVRALCRDWSGLDDVGRDAIIRRKGVAGFGELREQSEALGVRLIACEAGLRSEGITAADLEPGVEVAGIATFLDAIEDGPVLSC